MSLEVEVALWNTLTILNFFGTFLGCIREDTQKKSVFFCYRARGDGGWGNTILQFFTSKMRLTK